MNTPKPTIPDYILQKRYVQQVDPNNSENLPYAIIIHRKEWGNLDTLAVLPIIKKPVINVYTEIRLNPEQILFTLPLPYLQIDNPFQYELVYPNGKRDIIPLSEKDTDLKHPYLYWHLDNTQGDASHCYTLEGYDKDADVYLTLMQHQDKDTLDNIQVAFQEIQNISDTFRRNQEPIDWFEVS